MAVLLAGNSTVAVGDRVGIKHQSSAGDPDEYIVACPAKGKTVLISLQTGNRWTNATVRKLAFGRVPVWALVGKDFFQNYEVWLLP